LIGKQIAAVTNFKPKKIAGFLSEVLVLGISHEDGSVELLMPDRSIKNGAKIS
jgi:tRNA-binding protein